MTAVDAAWTGPADRARSIYFNALVGLTLLVAVASFVRVPGALLSNLTFWLCAATFVVSMVSARIGLAATVFLLTLSPILHQQLNTLLGTQILAWSWPGVDGVIGFIAARTLTGSMSGVRSLLRTFPAKAVLALHLWIACSAIVAVTRNVWQSASEFSWRGLASYAWFVRRIGYQDDYFPLQDLYIYTVAIVLILYTWSLLRSSGDGLLQRLGGAVLLGAAANAMFALWQRITGRGWFASGLPGIDVNALWPDIHSFASLMALGLAVGVGLIAMRRPAGFGRMAVLLATAGAAVGLYLSGSRSTLLIVAMLLCVAAVWGVVRLQGWRRAVSLGFLLLLLAGLDRTFSAGYRGVTDESLTAALGTFDFKTVNAALSYRPEIWKSALEMYSQFPAFGLGQGTFVRLSSVAGFSNSEVLVNLHGSGAHNYFLHSFVELGPVGLGIFLLFMVPICRLGRGNFQLISFYALAGIAIGNVYAHSLLVREMLMLAAIFLGTYLWEAQTLVGDGWRPPEARSVRVAALALVVASVVALVEVGSSFRQYPFTYGQLCYEERPLAPDKWTHGALRVEFPPGSTGLDLGLRADRKDLAWRPLDVSVDVVDGDGRSAVHRLVRFEVGSEPSRDLSLSMDTVTTSKRYLKIRASHCYVPLNVGRGHDGRPLGVRVTKLQFKPAPL